MLKFAMMTWPVVDKISVAWNLQFSCPYRKFVISDYDLEDVFSEFFLYFRLKETFWFMSKELILNLISKLCLVP